MKVGIINLNSGNLLSMVSAIEKIGHQTTVLNKPQGCFDALILPGQGRFGFIAAQLDKAGWREYILDWIAQDGLFIGVCVGMQLLFDSSQEDVNAKGLGVFAGVVEKLQHPKTPMVGWALLDSQQILYAQQYVYFVNSYGVMASGYCLATVLHGSQFCAIVQYNNVYGFQFHPEKSGDYGLEVLRKCLL